MLIFRVYKDIKIFYFDLIYQVYKYAMLITSYR